MPIVWRPLKELNLSLGLRKLKTGSAGEGIGCWSRATDLNRILLWAMNPIRSTMLCQTVIWWSYSDLNGDLRTYEIRALPIKLYDQ